MKLAIVRSQTETTDRKGRHTGYEFTIGYQLRVAADAMMLIDDYGLASRYVLGDYNSPSELAHTVERLLRGSSYTSSRTDIVLEREHLAIKAGRNAAALLGQISAFDGRERVTDLNPGGTSLLDE